MAGGSVKHEAEYGSRRQRAYWLALGRFLDEFAIVEATLNWTLWHYAKLDATIARGLLGQQRSDRAMQDINRVIEARGLKSARVGELTIIFDQLGKLNRMRNDIVHFGAGEERDGNVIVSNRVWSHVEFEDSGERRIASYS